MSMTATSVDQSTRSSRIEKAFDLMTAKNFEAAEAELNAGAEDAAQAQDKVMEALFYSTLGVLHKLKKDFKGAWRFYDKAEKILPEDPALKLISARLLVEVFGQLDTAIKKAEKVLNLAKNDRPFTHQAQATLGLAYLKKGDKKRALQCLNDAMAEDFDGIISAGNIDLKLLEALSRKKLGLTECKQYLEKAHLFAQKTGEERLEGVFLKLIQSFPGP